MSNESQKKGPDAPDKKPGTPAPQQSAGQASGGNPKGPQGSADKDRAGASDGKPSVQGKGSDKVQGKEKDDKDKGGGDGKPPEPPKGKQAAARKPSRLPGILMFLLVIAAIALGVVAALHAQAARELALENQQGIARAASQIAEAQEQTRALPQTVSALEASVREQLSSGLEQTRASIEQNSAAIAEEQTRQQRRLETLEQGVRAIQEEAERPQRDWQVAEVLYLMNIANHRIEFMDDAAGARAALNAADSMLQASGDPSFGPVRDAIATEVAALSAYEGVQMSAILRDLDALVADVKPLPLKMPEISETGPLLGLGQETPAETAPKWEQYYHRVIQEIGRHITLRRHSQAVRSMPDAEAELFIRQVVALRLEGARLAALRHDADDFRANLQRARELLGDYFAAEQVAPIAQRIEELSQRELRKQRPAVGQARDLLVQLEG